MKTSGFPGHLGQGGLSGATGGQQGPTRGQHERDLPQIINGGCVASLFKRIMPLVVGRPPAQLLHAVADLRDQTTLPSMIRLATLSCSR